MFWREFRPTFDYFITFMEHLSVLELPIFGEKKWTWLTLYSWWLSRNKLDELERMKFYQVHKMGVKVIFYMEMGDWYCGNFVTYHVYMEENRVCYLQVLGLIWVVIYNSF